MNLQQLRYLVATGDVGTITAAARQLHVAQPAVSRALRALEAELGVELLVREGRNVRLTPAGEKVLAAARAAVEAADRVLTVARAEAEAAEPISVVTTPTLEPLVTGRILPAFQARRPGRTVRLRRAAGRDEVAAELLAGDAEVGLADLPLPDGLEAIELGSFEIVLVSPPGSSLPPVVGHEVLDGLPLLLPGAATTRRREFEAFFETAGVTPVVALETDERSSWLEGVLAGVGSVLWYDARVAEAVQRGARRSSFDPPLTRSIGVAHRSGPLGPDAAAMVECAVANGLPGPSRAP